MTADVAALPEEKATQYLASSESATARSKAPRVGFPISITPAKKEETGESVHLSFRLDASIVDYLSNKINS